MSSYHKLQTVLRSFATVHALCGIVIVAFLVSLSPKSSGSDGNESEVPVNATQADRTNQETTEKISINATNVEITDVLHHIAQQTGRNIVWEDEVRGKVTVMLNDVPWEKALSGILHTKGYRYYREGAIIYVTAGERDDRIMKTEVIRLQYGRVKEVQALVEPLLSKNGKLYVDTRKSSLIVTDTPSKIEEIKKVIRSID